MAKKTTPIKKRKRTLKRNLGIGVLMAGVLYIGIHILSRTDGIRSMVADKISNGTRLPVVLERCGATPLLGLRLQGLGFYGAKMPDVRIKFNFLSFLSKEKPWVRQLDIQNMEVKFQRVPDTGNWSPLVLHGLGSKLGIVLGLNPSSMPDDEALPKFPAWVINQQTRLQLRHAKVVWYDEKNKELAYLTDTDTRIKVVSLSERKAVQTQLQCGHIKLASGRVLRDFKIETLKIEGYPATLILRMSDSDGEYDGFQTESFWQDLNLHLNSLSEL